MSAQRPKPFRLSRAVVAMACATLLAGACADPSAPGVAGGTGGGGPIEMPVDTTPTVDPGAPPPPTPRTLVLLADGDQPVTEVARALLDAHAPGAGARRDSVTPLLATRGFIAPLTASEAAAVASDERVESAEPPQVVTADGLPARMAPAGVGVFGQHALVGAEFVGAAFSATPWALDRMTQRALPLDGAATFTGSGAGVTIYVIDTGIRASHVEYAGRVTYGPDFIDGGTTTGDCNGHGTKVASDAAGATMGTARQAKIVGVRVLDCNGSGSSVTVVQGIDWVISQVQAHPGPAVINMSLGVNGVCVPVNDAAARATLAGITVVVAAGNSNANACNFSPAGSPTAITVGATDVTDTRASFSNWGSCLDLYAPGANVDGADHASDNAYAPWSGTSAASPFVAGVAALYLEQFPDAAPAQVQTALTAGATSSVVKGTNTTGAKLVYLPASASQTPNTPPSTFVAPPVPVAAITCVRRACTLDGRGSTDDVKVSKWSWAYGDGLSGSAATATHRYAANGTYVVRLTVTSSRNLSATRVDTVRVTDGAPTVHGAATCSGWTCTFDATAADDGQVTRLAWTFSEGNALSGRSTHVVRTFRAAGTYTATVIATDDVGQADTVVIRATTTPRPPTPAARVTCTGLTCTFDASGSVDDLGLSGYTWDFLDQTFQTGVHVTKTYPTKGLKKFKLTVRNTSNLSTTMQGQFTLR